MITIKKCILAILDKEKDYINRFMAYVNQIKEEDFMVLAFSNIDSFLACSREEQVEVLLISEDLFFELKKEQQIEDKVQIVLLCEGGSMKQEEEYSSVYKYQSVIQILHDIKDMYHPKKRMPSVKFQQTEKQKKVIAVYATAGGSKKTCFSLGLAQILGAENKCLYLNFNFFSGFFERGTMTEKGMSDFIYYLKQTEENPFKKSINMTRSICGFDYYLPPSSPFDLLELDALDCDHLLCSMRENSDYDYMILDIGIWNKAMLTLLLNCDVLYYPLSRGTVDERKLKEFRHFLQMEDKEFILEKMVTITIPEDKRMRGEFEITDLTKGAMGDFIESVLFERKENNI